MTDDWLPDWSAKTVVLLGSGPTAAAANLEAVRGKARVLAINSSWLLAPWADALYACDGLWWQQQGGCPDFEGLKITADREAAERWGLQRIRVTRGERRMLFDPPGRVGGGENSGFHAVNLIAQLGVRRIVLVGFDMRVDRGVHWHPPHTGGLGNPTETSTRRWRLILDAAGSELAARGIEVLNASPESALKAYPKVDLVEALLP